MLRHRHIIFMWMYPAHIELGTRFSVRYNHERQFVFAAIIANRKMTKIDCNWMHLFQINDLWSYRAHISHSSAFSVSKQNVWNTRRAHTHSTYHRIDECVCDSWNGGIEPRWICMIHIQEDIIVYSDCDLRAWETEEGARRGERNDREKSQRVSNGKQRVRGKRWSDAHCCEPVIREPDWFFIPGWYVWHTLYDVASLQHIKREWTNSVATLSLNCASI